MFGSFDDMFDFDRDGKLDSFERAAEFQFMDDMLREENEEHDSFFDDDDDEEDALEAAGLDYDDLDEMDEDERAEALEDAGLDPDDYDF